jgi:hypothetical protein
VNGPSESGAIARGGRRRVDTDPVIGLSIGRRKVGLYRRDTIRSDESETFATKLDQRRLDWKLLAIAPAVPKRQAPSSIVMIGFLHRLTRSLWCLPFWSLHSSRPKRSKLVDLRAKTFR